MLGLSKRDGRHVEVKTSTVVFLASLSAATAFVWWKASTRQQSCGSEDASTGKQSDFIKAARARIEHNESRGCKSEDVASRSNGRKAKAHHLTREKFKEERRQSKLEHLSMKKPMYDNVIMLDPHGEVLCTISKKKARWYISKGLAEWENDKIVAEEKTSDSEQNLKIRINFEPKNRSNRGKAGIYVRTAKENKCVVCGSAKHLMRHYVVPYAYRSLLPQQYKTHLSHDIVILCPDCHLHCEQHRQKRMTDMEEACRTSYLKSKNILSVDFKDKNGEINYHLPLLTDPVLYHVRSCALALLNWKHSLPEEKRICYENVVREYFISHHPKTIDEESSFPTLAKAHDFVLSPKVLQEAVDVDYKIPNENYISGAELIVEGLGIDDNLIADFIRDWRRHFLAVAQPRFMPVGWSVNSSVVCGED